jgi:hypothetical protein
MAWVLAQWHAWSLSGVGFLLNGENGVLSIDLLRRMGKNYVFYFSLIWRGKRESLSLHI